MTALRAQVEEKTTVAILRIKKRNARAILYDEAKPRGVHVAMHVVAERGELLSQLLRVYRRGERYRRAAVHEQCGVQRIKREDHAKHARSTRRGGGEFCSRVALVESLTASEQPRDDQ